LARLAAPGLDAATMAADDVPDARQRRALGRQPRTLAHRLRWLELTLCLRGALVVSPPPQAPAQVRRGSAARQAALGRRGAPLAGSPALGRYCTTWPSRPGAPSRSCSRTSRARPPCSPGSGTALPDR